MASVYFHRGQQISVSPAGFLTCPEAGTILARRVIHAFVCMVRRMFKKVASGAVVTV